MPCFLCFFINVGLCFLVRHTGHRLISLGYAGEKFVQVATASFTSQISVVRRRDETDRLGGTCKHVTDVVGQPLQEVRSELDLVVNDIVVRGTRRPLKTAVRYREFMSVSL